MKKQMIALSATMLLLTTSLLAEEKSTAEGYYLGLGGGVSFDGAFLSNGHYFDNGSSTYDVGTLSDISGGFLLYGGYQFNKIIAVEASYTYYGSFSDSAHIESTAQTETFSSKPQSGALYANAGYTFTNGLRPFGQLGLGYMNSHTSSSLDNLDFADKFMTMHWGLGLEYAPQTFKGFGLRVAVSGDTYMDYSYDAKDDNGITESAILIRNSEMLYVGAQYKF